jgi:hypothetical protein
MMHPLLSALAALAPTHDPELMDGLERYVALLETILTPAQLDTYAALVQRTGTVHIFEDLTPDELAAMATDEMVVATTIMADETATMENRRVEVLLQQRQTY